MGTHPIFESDFDCLTELVLSVRMNSVLDGIGTDSDTSAASGDGEPKVKRRAISLKAVVSALENSPSKLEKQQPINKPMPQLIPAPRAFLDSVSDRQEPIVESIVDGDGDDKGGVGGKPRAAKARFWQYEEIDEKPKEKAKRKLPNELARLQDTEEYLEASKGIKSSSNISERSKRPPRRAAIRARETVNFLHGNVENGLELRGTRRALEKQDNAESDSEQEHENEQVQDASFLSNSDLFDADSGDEEPQQPQLVRRLSSDENNPPRVKRPKLEKSKSDSSLAGAPKMPSTPPKAAKPDFGGIFSSPAIVASSSFKIPKKKNKDKDRKSPKVDKDNRKNRIKEDKNGNVEQEKWSKRVIEVKEIFHKWVNEMNMTV